MQSPLFCRGASRTAEETSAMKTDDVIVSFRGVRKTYDGETLVVKQLDPDIYQGELLTLLGPSGSGKTTCLMMLAGFGFPTGGKIWRSSNVINTRPAAEAITDIGAHAFVHGSR